MSRVLLDDFAGHAFMLDLAVAMKRAGHEVTYQYCESNLSPHADFEAADVPVVAISLSRPFEKYKIWRRALSELAYGWSAARTIRDERPDVAILNNLPMLSLIAPLAFGRMVRSHRLVWLQDLQSGLVGGVTGQRGLVALIARWVEGFVLRRADSVVAISDDLAASVRGLGVKNERVHVIENWAPVEHFPLLDRDNDWSRSQGLSERVRFIYSGTLARKHSPGLLLDLALAIPEIDVVVASEGVGAQWLADEGRARAVDNLWVLPFQPFADLPSVLAAGDVLVLLLTDDASSHSVPSKGLSYLCAGRSILASIPAANSAARMISERAFAGVVVPPADADALISEAKRLADDADLRATLGDAGRHFAEKTFSSDHVARQLESILSPVAPA